MKPILFLALILLQTGVSAAPGDSVKVRSHDKVHMNWYGNFDTRTFFPTSGKSWNRIKMYYTLGCPNQGCSEWDYTTQVFLRQHTGKTDSTLMKAPNFTFNGATPDSLIYNTDSTYSYFFNSQTSAIDSVARQPGQLILFGDAGNPQVATDTLTVWNALVYRPVYDANGMQVDSTLIPFQQVIRKNEHSWYTNFEVINNLELGRVITPYAGDKDKNWSYTYTFDVTDFAYLLKDSVDIRAHFSGYQDGFTISLDFEFIEGKPAMECYSIIPLWQGSFPYGNPNNSIENYLKPVSFAHDTAAKVKLRVIQTGHGFGGNENCAEFCPKSHFVKVNGSQKHSSLVWREDCGLNPIYPQTGTWLYDRANWCPGSEVKPFDYFIEPHLSAGSNQVDLDMESFTNINNNSCSYTVSGMLFLYRQPAYTIDIAMEDVIAPNNKSNYTRVNPICGEPVVRVSNQGTETIQSIKFLYGAVGGSPQFFEWKGTIEPYQSAEVKLGYPDWTGAASGRFFCEVLSGNDKPDEFSQNNRMESSFVLPDKLPKQFLVQFRTNAIAGDNEWTIKSLDGSIRQKREGLKANTAYYDTVNLPLGCYVFELTDKQKNGLKFWANNEGTGVLSFRQMSNILIKNFNMDFGTSLRYQFTVDFVLEEEQPALSDISIYPNPATNRLEMEGKQERYTVTLYDVNGRTLISQEIMGSGSLDLSDIAPSVYWLRVESESGVRVEKIAVVR